MTESLSFCDSAVQPVPCVASPWQAMLGKDLGTWRFDVFKLAKLCDNRPLVVTGEACLRPSLEKLELNGSQAVNFLDMVEARYHTANPYHNNMHGADVLNS